MTVALFRDIAQDPFAASGTMVSTPVRTSVLTAFLVITLAAAMTFAATTEYASKQTTTGVLVPRSGIIRVDPPRAGTMTELSVADGQTIHAGDALFTVDFRQSLEGGETLDATLRASLDRQQALLREQIASEEARGASERTSADRRVDDLSSELRALATQLRLQEDRKTVAENRLNAVRDLWRRGLISEADFHGREDTLLAQRQEYAVLQSRIAATTYEYHQAVARREMLPGETADRLGKLQSGLADLRQREAEVSARGALVVRAPADGRITALQVARGQRVEPGKPVLAIMPKDTPLNAALYVPSRAIGFVRPGQTVRMMYDAFPYQRFGTHGGVVEAVSDTVLAPADVIGPAHPKEPSYQVLVRLDRDTIDAFGRTVALRPDMTVRADIVLERRGLLAWLFEPLLSMKGRM